MAVSNFSCLLLGLTIAASSLRGASGFTQDTKPQAKAGTYRYAAVATDSDICSPVGVDIMAQHQGSAVDATIASFLCTCVVNAESCGIGGGFLATIYDRPKGSEHRVMTTVTAREKAPSAAHKDMYIKDPSKSMKGGLAVGVPGEIFGFYEAWKKFGRVPWRKLIEPTIRVCREGFAVERALAEAIEVRQEHIEADENLKEILMNDDGSFKKQGDLLVNEKLAHTFERIADDPMSFYTGSLADDIIADLNDYGGIITKEDLASYGKTSIWKEPVKLNLKNGNYTINNVPPPSSGVVLDYMLNILDGYNFNERSIANIKEKGLTYHRIAEAFKFAYAKRSMLGDNEFVDTKELVDIMLSRDEGAKARNQINDYKTQPMSFYGASFDIKKTPGTSHMNVLAPDGSAMALTGTINTYFGSKVRGKRTGIIFNNEMDDFSTPGTVNFFGVPASPSNYIAPGKRPMSSMSPSIVLNPAGNVVLLAGAEGGSRITTSTALMIMNVLWFGLDPEEASNMPRIHHQLAPHVLEYEYWMDKALVRQLASRQHDLIKAEDDAVSSVIQNVCEMTDDCADTKACLRAVSDGRKGGAPDGF